MSIDSKPKPRTHEVIAEQLRKFIKSSNLKPDMRLPNEHILSIALSTSRPTLRTGLLSLELAGEIEIVNGSGTYVRDPKKTLSIEIEDCPGPMQILDARTTMECSIAAEAAIAGTPESFLALELTLTRMKNKTAPIDYAYWDRAFHISIAEATGQPLLSSIIGELMHRLDSSPGRREQSTSVSDELADHEVILDAICQRDPLRASREMRRHLNRAREILLGRTECDPPAIQPHFAAETGEDRQRLIL